jgi:type I restriction-modification system DNA methylase subunit
MLEDIKKTLWATADKLRANMDAAEYKHLVLGLIFVKYISDTFSAKRAELTRRFADPADEYFLPDSTPALLAGELEDRDYYGKSMSSGCPRPRAGRRCVPPPSSPTSASALTTRCR